jgi:peptidoglycan/xylan/chitin deacetylase (PgdA/CDA1 family)
MKTGAIFVIILAFFVACSNEYSNEVTNGYFSGAAEAPEPIPIPILMFHVFSTEVEEISDMVVTQSQFRNFLLAMLDAGHSPITFAQLVNYVSGQGDLPENPFVVTIDDGYLCNFTLAFPVVQELQVPVIINIIGSRRGQNTYQNMPSIPHFTWEQAREMFESGLVDFGNHTWEMHGAPGVTEEGRRVGVRKFDGETTDEFVYALNQDISLMHSYFHTYFGGRSVVFAYPFGWVNDTAEQVFAENGYLVTLATGQAVSLVRRYDPASLFGLTRINVSGHLSEDDLISLVQTKN